MPVHQRASMRSEVSAPPRVVSSVVAIIFSEIECARRNGRGEMKGGQQPLRRRSLGRIIGAAPRHHQRKREAWRT